MFNPSIADEFKDDHTIRKLVGFCKRWGYGSFVVVNLFAYRSPNPRDLATVSNVVGPAYDMEILKALDGVKTLVCAWGCEEHMKQWPNRPYEVLRLIKYHHIIKLRCFGLTKNGTPRHPLMLPYTTPLVPYVI